MSVATGSARCLARSAAAAVIILPWGRAVARRLPYRKLPLGRPHTPAMILPLLATWTPEPLAPSATVEDALGLLLDEGTGVLPVVDATDRFIGVVTERMLLEADSPDAFVSTVFGAPPVTIAPEAHVFEATKLMIQHDLAAIAVVDDDRHYYGFARRHDIFERFARMLATQEAGAVVSVEVPARDLALSQLVYAAEQNGVHVRSIVSELPDTSGEDGDGEGLSDAPARVTLKLDTTDAARVRAMLEHYGYRVVASYGERENDDDLQDRVRAFMRYLEV